MSLEDRIRPAASLSSLGTVLEQLHRAGPLSRSELTRASGLSRSTIGILVRDLVNRGLAEEQPGSADGRRGRPSPVVELKPGRAVAIAVDIEVETFAVATYGLGGVILALERSDQPRDPSDPAAVVAAVRPFIEGQRAALSQDQVLIGIGVAIAGVVRNTDGLVNLCPNLGWHDAPLGRLIADAVDVADGDVVVGNEADMGAFAEWYRGAGQGHRHVVYLSAEVGVGGGVVVDGRLLAGADGYAGEAGHLPVNPAGVPCRCGARGCWETEVGGPALVRKAADHGLQARCDEVLTAAAEGDQAALAAVADVARWNGWGLAGILNVFNPEKVVLGGLLARINQLAGPTLLETVADQALGPIRGASDIEDGQLGGLAQLIGAAEVVMTSVFNDPAIVPILRPARDRDCRAVAGQGV